MTTLKGKSLSRKKRVQVLKTNPTLFGDDDADVEIYDYAMHFRRQLKARLVKHKVVTQIVRETTLTPDDAASCWLR